MMHSIRRMLACNWWSRHHIVIGGADIVGWLVIGGLARRPTCTSDINKLAYLSKNNVIKDLKCNK